MYCIIQEISTKKPNQYGHCKELISYVCEMSFNGEDQSYWAYKYGEERFERPVKKAYKISIHQSYREDGVVRKKQFCLCTVNYYYFADEWFSLYDCCDNKIVKIASELSVTVDEIYTLVNEKLNPLIDSIQVEFQGTEEYKTHQEHEKITTVYAAKKTQFNEEYGFESTDHEYDKCYDVFGNLQNPEYLKKIESDFAARQEYEKQSRENSRGYYDDFFRNYRNSGSSGYSNLFSGNHNEKDKDILKQFYKVLAKKFHPDSNPDCDTSEQMQVLNQIKDEWGI